MDPDDPARHADPEAGVASRRLTLADAEVARVRIEGDALHVRFAAAPVSERDPLAFGGVREGWMLGIDLVGHGIGAVQIPMGALGRLAEGRVRTAAGWCGTLPLPAAWPDAVALELQFADGTRLAVALSGLTLRAGPDARLREAFAC